eukprot:2886359-Rhodomonas_salina.2
MTKGREDLEEVLVDLDGGGREDGAPLLHVRRPFPRRQQPAQQPVQRLPREREQARKTQTQVQTQTKGDRTRTPPRARKRTAVRSGPRRERAKRAR